MSSEATPSGFFSQTHQLRPHPCEAAREGEAIGRIKDDVRALGTEIWRCESLTTKSKVGIQPTLPTLRTN